MTPICALVLVAASLVGCGPKYSKLKADKIQSLTVTVQDTRQRFCVGQRVPLRALVTYEDGKQVPSRTPGESKRGRLPASAFNWSSSQGTVGADGVLSLPRDLLAWFDEPIRVSASVRARPEIVAEVALHPRFDCGGAVDVRGADGYRGGEAEEGGPGGAGGEVHVALAYVDTEHSGRLLLVRVHKGSAPGEHYIVAPRSSRAQFVIAANGGDGGRGGQGVVGMAGLAGVDGQNGTAGVGCVDGTPGQDGTDGEAGGPGGPGGTGGRGGNGGRVFVHYDARFPELPEQIRIRVEGGEGGAFGPGGAGGSGGRGGRGGAGGKGGSDLATDSECRGADGGSGSDGANGTSGSPGPDGAPGMPGAAGEVRTSAVDVAELFADELKRGVPIASSAGAS